MEALRGGHNLHEGERATSMGGVRQWGARRAGREGPAFEQAWHEQSIEESDQRSQDVVGDPRVADRSKVVGVVDFVQLDGQDEEPVPKGVTYSRLVLAPMVRIAMTAHRIAVAP